MSKFADLLNQPLPSQMGSEAAEDKEMSLEDFTESLLDNADMALSDDGSSDDDTTPDLGDDSDDVGTDDIEDIADGDEEDDLDAEDLKDLSLDDTPSDDDVKLTPDEEIKADDMMSVAATAMLVNDELSADEKKELCENVDELNVMVNEGFMLPSDITSLQFDSGLVTEGQYNNKQIIRLSAASKKKQLYALAINISAAAHGDPDYKKYKKVMKMRKILRAKMERKYKSEATKRMKVYFARLRASKSKVLNGIAKTANK